MISNRTGNTYALLLTTAELNRKTVRLIRQSDQRQNLRDAWSNLAAFPPGSFQTKGDVLRHGAGMHQIKVLKNHANALMLFVVGELIGHAEETFERVRHGVQPAVALGGDNRKVDRSSFNYSRFMMHLKYFSSRVLCNEKIKQKDIGDIYEQFLEKDILLQRAIHEIERYLYATFKYELILEEKLYLSIRTKVLMD